MGECDVADDAFAKESRFVRPGTRAVKELVGNHKIGRGVLLLQAADSRDRQDVFDPEQLHRVDVCPIGKFARRELMPASMPRQKRNGYAIQVRRQ